MIPEPDRGPQEVRCAIYTRKSTDENLNLSFNSLHAQREAAEAYIRSQQSLGWRLLERDYNDAGFTGANMDRPALRLLLADIAAGVVNCVLVYKVDRLSRSLLDFARIMEIFERHRVTFVSITQQFNTASSLGRLTLNILLSFAQFEREIIAERTRDKQAAAKRKGKWTGGCLVLGYDVDPRGRKLEVNEKEAEHVRAIFELFVEKRDIRATVDELARRNWTAKSWVTRQERLHQGSAIREDSLRRLLSNPLYMGVVRHDGQDYPGEHPAIVDRATWEQARQLLATHRAGHRRLKAAGLLCGLLWCDQCGAQMTATMSRRSGRVHRYYFCPTSAADRNQCATRYLPLDRFEQIVLGEISRAGGDSNEDDASRISSLRYADQTGRLTIRLSDGLERQVTIERTRVRHGRLVLRPVQEQPHDQDAHRCGRVPRISRLVALAIRIELLTSSGELSNKTEAARLASISRARLTHITNLNYLAPDIQERLLFLDGTTAGRDLVSERDMRAIAAQLHWVRQRRMFEQLLSEREQQRAVANRKDES
jgi:DNA invertase Pin-like site-specific DNA recombinase